MRQARVVLAVTPSGKQPPFEVDVLTLRSKKDIFRAFTGFFQHRPDVHSIPTEGCHKIMLHFNPVSGHPAKHTSCVFMSPLWVAFPAGSLEAAAETFLRAVPLQ